MCRRSTKAEILALLAKLRDRLPGLVLRTSLICGLPGEGKAEFEELCEFLREARIERAGIFQFSPEEGTPAAEMGDQVDAATAERRVELVVELQSRVMDAFNGERLGECLEVLCEGFDAEMGCYVGRTYADSPRRGRQGVLHRRRPGARRGVRLGAHHRHQRRGSHRRDRGVKQ